MKEEITIEGEAGEMMEMVVTDEKLAPEVKGDEEEEENKLIIDAVWLNWKLYNTFEAYRLFYMPC